MPKRKTRSKATTKKVAAKAEPTLEPAPPGPEKYRIVGSSHTRFEGGDPVRYKRGDEIELTEDEASRIAWKVEKI